MSKVVSVYTPVGHRPDWYWEDVFTRRGIEIEGTVTDFDTCPPETLEMPKVT